MNKLLCAALLIFTLASCKNDVPSAPAEPAPAPVTPSPSVPEQPRPEAPENRTAVEVGSDGVSVESKTSSNKTDVSIKNGKAAVDIKSE